MTDTLRDDLEGWISPPLVALSGHLVNVHHIERILPASLGTAKVSFASGRVLECREPFTMVMSLVAGTFDRMAKQNDIRPTPAVVTPNSEGSENG